MLEKGMLSPQSLALSASRGTVSPRKVSSATHTPGAASGFSKHQLPRSAGMRPFVCDWETQPPSNI